MNSGSNNPETPISAVLRGEAINFHLSLLPSRSLQLYVDKDWRVLYDPDYEVQQLILNALSEPYQFKVEVRYSGSHIEQIDVTRNQPITSDTSDTSGTPEL
ncbi:hypothetical protein [Wukongibacter baidiensis]